jgi:hypothetical protein
MPAFKEGNHPQGNESHDTPGEWIPEGVFQFGHILKVHAIYANHKGQGNKNG